MFRRKIYKQMLAWKEESNGRTALLIEGQRRVGKPTVVEEFARNEYESYILVDFYSASPATKKLFDDLSDLNYIFLQLQLTYHKSLRDRKSCIIFDEVQLCPKARSVIKALVKDGRYDYIETGSLISIHRNITLAFKHRSFTDNDIYSRLLSDKLQANLGYIYENMIAQTLATNGYELYYHTFLNEKSKHNYEVDFLIADHNKICPIELTYSHGQGAWAFPADNL